MKRTKRSREGMNEGFWEIAKNIGDVRKNLNRNGHLGRSVTPRAVGTEFATVFNTAGERAPVQQKRDMSLLADYVVGQLMSLDPSKFRRVMMELIRTLARELAKFEGQQPAPAGVKTEAALAGGRVTEEKLREAIRADLLVEKKRRLNEDVMAALKELILAFADSLKRGEIPEEIGNEKTRAVMNKSLAQSERILKASGINAQIADTMKDFNAATAAHALLTDEEGKEGLTKALVTKLAKVVIDDLKKLLAAKAKAEEAEKAKAEQSGQEQSGQGTEAQSTGAQSSTSKGPTQQAANQQKT